ncbi:autorepressor SdpR family transcription factor [Geobacillus sp. AYS3]|uniref:autorepressor SdpR family transcription factor n=1 Tax=Geobacillus sp. AYS3 TaxID=2603623 RepID=UPI0011C88743|nr:autorepressor SdpR family transcription factor [Geobacillus sp. AYS3]TXK86572.1 winged helix-turn-helix transcriptional regulator [Geobacillus sp. AYS3]
MKINLVYKALADPTRRDILNLLKNRDLTAGEKADHFRISKPSISHHLNLLKQADLVHAEKEGQYIYYSINTTVLQDVLVWLLSLQEGERKKE